MIESHIAGSKYQEAIIAFIDIMGFKKIIDKTESNTEFFNTLTEVLEKVAEKSNKFNNSGTTGYIFFSDSILIYRLLREDETLPTSLVVVENFSGDLLLSLLEQGYCARGGITKGKIYHDSEKRIFFGPGINKAYLLEQSASYPRIILDKNIIREIPSDFPSDIYTQRDFDGVSVYNYFNYLDISEYKPAIIKAFIISNLSTLSPDSKEYRYWYYLAKKFNEWAPNIIRMFNLIANSPTNVGEVADSYKESIRSLDPIAT